MRDLRRAGMTMLVATHEMAFAREIADAVFFLHAGRIVESGPPSQVLEHPVEARTRQFLLRVIEAGRFVPDAPAASDTGGPQRALGSGR